MVVNVSWKNWINRSYPFGQITLLFVFMYAIFKALKLYILFLTNVLFWKLKHKVENFLANTCAIPTYSLPISILL